MYDKTAALRRIDAVIAQGPYTDTWESLSGWQPPKWYRNAKFGIFIHWGVYSVPAFENEWYPRNMYIEGSKAFEHHVKTYGAHKDFGYKDFIPLFRAEKFDPAAWAALFRRAYEKRFEADADKGEACTEAAGLALGKRGGGSKTS